MNSVERVKAICAERGIAISRLEKELGFSNGYIGQLRKGIFPSDRLDKIASYLNVDRDYLLYGEKQKAPASIGKRGSFASAQKLGRDWFVDEDEPWPDRRVKSGAYKKKAK